MIFIDDIDSDELSLKACVYAADAGWQRYGNEAPYEVSTAFCSGYMDGYRAAIADEKARYAEAKKRIEEAHQKEKALYLASVNKLSKEEIIEHWEKKLSERAKKLLDRMRSERFEDK